MIGGMGWKTVAANPVVAGSTIPVRRGKRGGLCYGLLALAASLSVWLPVTARANPLGGTVAAGSATVVQTSPTRVDVVQQSNQAILNWQSFSIGKGEQTNFQQPSSSAIALNRVTGGDLSTIEGALTANGTVMLVNPNGVIFTKGAEIDVGSLVVTTANLRDADFMAGRMQFLTPSGVVGASVVNKGTITVAAQGIAALVAPTVANAGVISARLGKVALAGAQTFTLDMYGDQLIQFDASAAVKQKQDGSLVSNSGVISADGGTVFMTARAAAGVVNSVVNMSGVVEARSVAVTEGKIILSGGDNGAVEVSGKLDASGSGAGEKGGQVQVLGEQVALRTGASIDVSGSRGGGTALVGGDQHGDNPAVPNATQTLVEKEVTMDASATQTGNGGKVVVWADEATSFQGTILAKGGAAGGDGGFVETSGKQTLQVLGGKVDASATAGKAGEWLMDPNDIEIKNAATTNGAFDGGTPTNAFTTTTDAAIADVNTINTALSGGTSVTITTGTGAPNAGTGNITLTDAISKTGGGAATLTLTASNNIFLNNTITSTAGALGVQLTANVGAGTINLNSAGTIITSNGGSIAFNGATVLQAGSTISAGAGGVTFAGTVNGAQALVVNSAGNTQFNGRVGGATPLTSVTTDAAGTTIFNAAGAMGTPTVKTTGLQLYNDPVTLSAATVLTSTGSGNITFGGTVNGASALEVDTAGSTQFNGLVGGTTPLASVMTDSAGTTTFNAAGATGTPTVKTTGVQTYDDPVTLLAATVLTSTGGGTITFGSTVDGANTLAFDTSGLVAVDGKVGNTNALNTLTITQSSSADFADTVRVGKLVLTDTSGSVSFVSIAGTGIAYAPGAPIAMGAGGNITIDSTAAGQIGGILGAGTSVVLNAATAVSIGSTVDVSGTAGASGKSLSFAATTINVASGVNVKTNNGDLTFTGDVTLAGGTASTFATGGGNLSITGKTSLGGDLTVTTGSGGVTFSDTVDGGHALVVNSAGNTQFNGRVGGGTALVSVTMSNASGTTTFNAAGTTGVPTVRTTGGQTYNGSVTLSAATVLTSTGSGTIALNGGLTGAGKNLTINTAGTVNLGDGTGADSLTGLGILDVTGTGGINIAASAIDSTGFTQEYHNAVVLQPNNVPNTLVTLTGTTVTFDSTVNATTKGKEGLVVTGAAGSGNAVFKGDVGSGTNLGSVSVAGTTAFNGATAVTTDSTGSGTGNQTYGGMVTLGNNLALTATGAGAIALNGGVIGSGKNLTINAIGTVNLGDGTGADSLTGLGILDVTGTGGINIAASAIDSTGFTQEYHNAVVLQPNNVPNTLVTLTGTTVTFDSTVNATTKGKEGLIVTGAAGSGNAVFKGNVGSGTNLGSLSVTGASAFNGATAVTTDSTGGGTGNQTYGGAVTLGNTLAMTSTGGNIAFNSTLDGAQPLSLTASSGNVTFTGAVGSGARLGVITITSAANVTESAGITAASLTQTAGSGTTTLTGLVTTTGAVALTANTIAVNGGITAGSSVALSGGTLAVNSAINSGSTVTVNETGTATLAAAGDITSTGAVSITAAGGISTAGDVKTTSSTITFASATTVTGPVILNSTGGNIRLTALTLNYNSSDPKNNRVIVASNGGNIDINSIKGGPTQYLDLRADINPISPANSQAYYVSGRENNPADGLISVTTMDVWNLTVAAKGVSLGTGFVWNNDSDWINRNKPTSNGFITNPTPAQWSKSAAAQTIMTPTNSGANITFNDYYVTGRLVDSVSSFSVPDLSKALSSNSQADLFVIAGDSRGADEGGTAEDAGFGVDSDESSEPGSPQP
ncbi:MAG: filamentous hemagglutinin N-terminal domain-containing protein [Magnetococcales bacterium]|nr:filamentous hemagglutinin N-terminal domain-containing protein [Magnetococcales bacterium]